MAYKIVKRHFLDEDPEMTHDDSCADIVYMINTGCGKYPGALRTLEEAQAKLDELINTRN